jgi:hypothetical protein
MCKRILFKIISVLKSIGFNENESDPCLLLKWSENDILLIGIFVDDYLLIGKEH